MELWIFCRQRPKNKNWLFLIFFHLISSYVVLFGHRTHTNQNWTTMHEKISIIIFFHFFGLWLQKIHSSKMVRPKRISLTESRGNGSFFILKSGVQFWFRALLGKMIAAPPGWQGAMKKSFIWAWLVVVHSIKNMFKTPGGIRWQIFFVQMKSGVCSLFLFTKTQNSKVKMNQSCFKLGTMYCYVPSCQLKQVYDWV